MNYNEKLNVMYEALKDVGTFFLVTAEDNIPHARPISFKMIFDNKIYLGIGKFKDCYKQILKNNHIELTGCKGPTWFRIDATVKLSDDVNALNECFKLMPHIKVLYEKNNWEMGMLYLEKGHAEFKNVINTIEEFEF